MTYIPSFIDPAVTLTFVHKSDVLFMCGSEPLCWAGAFLCGCTVVALPVQAVEDNLWGRRAGEITVNQRMLAWGEWGSLQQNTTELNLTMKEKIMLQIFD